MSSDELMLLDDVEPKPIPTCPDCGEEMTYHGGTRGFEHCDWKLLYRAGGWSDDQGRPVSDRRIRDDQL